MAHSDRGLQQRDSGCLEGEVAMNMPSCSQLQAGRSTEAK